MTNAWDEQATSSRIQLGDLHATADPEVEEDHNSDEGGGVVEFSRPGSSGERGLSTKKKELRRVWRQEWKAKHKWVYPIKNSEGELRLKCTWCTYYNMDNVYAREGCSTIQMSALNTHAKSEAHRAAESRICVPTSLALPDALYDGSKNGADSDGLDDVPGVKKRRFSTSPVNGGGGASSSPSTRAEVLGLIMHKNNSRVVQLLVDAESGRNARHATSVALAKKQLKLDERRLQIEQHLLEQDRARLEAHVRLGQSFIAALTDIGDGLKRIGNAMEAAKT
ncbi:hypothetical protein SELMODRAFT_437584 [Selaginella moellendorffii]|uniref:C17orf113 probable zinc finger domain-containing protein n=1 Tax=Selaginella moellendorffii TaxID=88036 RepID=D8QN72_SELML|nr:uncharacterized protein LOC9642259 [Selaginella moellendorffii]EFJ38706.1 hypothetical protein SELMODRAFT_437584 [Selaginella moellendorffii]|eukprot:XP_002961167.1 uncharacterized protein LOC9642259 [Selaginella moellendorffii]